MRPPPSSAPAWAAASMPAARPETTQASTRARSCARRRAKDAPPAVALRVPTMATTGGRSSSARRAPSPGGRTSTPTAGRRARRGPRATPASRARGASRDRPQPQPERLAEVLSRHVLAAVEVGDRARHAQRRSIARGERRSRSAARASRSCGAGIERRHRCSSAGASRPFALAAPRALPQARLDHPRPHGRGRLRPLRAQLLTAGRSSRTPRSMRSSSGPETRRR